MHFPSIIPKNALAGASCWYRSKAADHVEPLRSKALVSRNQTIMMTMTHAYCGFVFTITDRVEEPGYIVRFTDIPEIITQRQFVD